MPELRIASEVILGPGQAAELALLLDLEARWENLRTARSPAVPEPSTTQDLHGKQKAYEAFRAKLRGYNQRYTPAHVPEVLLNTPTRLGSWCRRMHDLYVLVEHAPQAPCPVHLLEKAFRCADQLATKAGKERISHPAPPDKIRTALENLEVLALWCEELTLVA